MRPLPLIARGMSAPKRKRTISEKWRWEIIDVETGKRVGRYKTSKRAQLWYRAYKSHDLNFRLQAYGGGVDQ